MSLSAEGAATETIQHDFRMLVEAVSDYAVYMLRPDGIVSSWNKGAERNKGYSSAEAIGLHVSSFYTAEDRADGAPERALSAAQDAKFETFGWRVRKDGSRFWARVVLEAIRDKAGNLVGFAKVTCDVTAQKVERDLMVRNLDAALSNMCQGLCLFDPDERLVLSNARISAILGRPEPSIEPGTSFESIFREMVQHQQILPAISASDLCDQQRALIRQTGGGSAILAFADDKVLSISHRPMADGSWVTTIEDISERSRSQRQVAHMALHDALTDLPNRIMFRDRLQEALNRVSRGETCAVLCLDLDRFKIVNDTLGHPVGDALLIAFTAKLRTLVREIDTVARLGGDEFAIVQSSIKQPLDATILADRLMRAFAEPFDVCGHLITASVSVGIALAPQEGLDPDHLLKCADLACYRAKTDGRARYCYFEPEMDAHLQKRRLLELDLRAALAARQFELYYQPIIDIRGDTLCGFEALLRWHCLQRGMVSPADFIPLAEEIGLIVDIGSWVLESACREAATWPVPVKVAVNVSAAQFKGFGLVEAVRSALALSGLPPERLEIEITESIMISDSEHACDVLHRLKALGITISMDDFGTGYSSLGYLRSFPFDKIKIDKSFIQGMGEAADCNAIVQAVMGICDSLGIVATAEGVETEDQLSMLRSRHCHQAQGYLISRPCPASNIPKLLGDLYHGAGHATMINAA